MAHDRWYPSTSLCKTNTLTQECVCINIGRSRLRLSREISDTQFHQRHLFVFHLERLNQETARSWKKRETLLCDCLKSSHCDPCSHAYLGTYWVSHRPLVWLASMRITRISEGKLCLFNHPSPPLDAERTKCIHHIPAICVRREQVQSVTAITPCLFIGEAMRFVCMHNDAQRGLHARHKMFGGEFQDWELIKSYRNRWLRNAAAYKQKFCDGLRHSLLPHDNIIHSVQDKVIRYVWEFCRDKKRGLQRTEQSMYFKWTAVLKRLHWRRGKMLLLFTVVSGN